MVTEPTPPDVYISEGLRSGSTPQETFRGVLRGRTVEHGSATVIVTRQGLGADARTWLTFDGAIKTTVALTDAEAAALGELLGKATGAGLSRRRSPSGQWVATFGSLAELGDLASGDKCAMLIRTDGGLGTNHA